MIKFNLKYFYYPQEDWEQFVFPVPDIQHVFCLDRCTYQITVLLKK